MKRDVPVIVATIAFGMGINHLEVLRVCVGLNSAGNIPSCFRCCAYNLNYSRCWAWRCCVSYKKGHRQYPLDYCMCSWARSALDLQMHCVQRQR